MHILVSYKSNKTKKPSINRKACKEINKNEIEEKFRISKQLVGKNQNIRNANDKRTNSQNIRLEDISKKKILDFISIRDF